MALLNIYLSQLCPKPRQNPCFSDICSTFCQKTVTAVLRSQCKHGVYRFCDILSRKTDEDAEREVLAVGVAEDELAEVEGLVRCLHAEGLLHYSLSEDG